MKMAWLDTAPIEDSDLNTPGGQEIRQFIRLQNSGRGDASGLTTNSTRASKCDCLLHFRGRWRSGEPLSLKAMAPKPGHESESLR